MSILGFTCTILITWEAELIVFTLGLTKYDFFQRQKNLTLHASSGGSAGLIYSYLFSFVGSIAVFTTMGELASMAPTSGGQYHWAAMLAPPFCKKIVSYLMGIYSPFSVLASPVYLTYRTGWLVICGWQAILAGSAYLGGNMIISLAQLNYPDYSPALWQGTLVYWCVMAVAILVNTYASKILPKLESFILILHIAGFFAMAEEIHDANIVIPWCMLSTTLLNGTLGFAMVIVVLFVTVDIDAVLASPTGLLGFPFMQIFHDATGSVRGASAMICIIIIMDICAAIAFLATSSRIVFAFGRDRGLPFWRTMSTVQADSAIPLYAISVMALVSCTIGLINIGSATAFNAVISVGVSSLYASYVLTEALLLYHRCTPGSIRHPTQMAPATWHPNDLVWGPFYVPGVWGILLNAFGVGYGVIVFVFSLFPTVVHPDAAHMNWSCLMTGSIMLFAVVYYYAYARKVYTGPVVEVAPY
ncbi:MAG: hypothetical protein Q9182_000852 [Xanthomendoza sp. 2 TL-2023]